jgi:hypothetical protein
MSQSRTVAIVGFLAAGALILGLGFCLGGDGTTGPSHEIAPLHIHTPADGDTLANPVTLVFSTPAPLELDPSMGWTAHDMHLHAMADSVEIMPAAADIAPRGDSVFHWRLPALPAGPHRIHLTWAGRHHGNLRGTADTIRVHILP